MYISDWEYFSCSYPWFEIGNVGKLIFIYNNFFQLKINFKTKTFYFFLRFSLNEHTKKCSFLSELQSRQVYIIFIMASSSSSDKILTNTSLVVVKKMTKIKVNNINIMPERILKIEY